MAETPVEDQVDRCLAYVAQALGPEQQNSAQATMKPHIGPDGAYLTHVAPFKVNHHGQPPPRCEMLLTDVDSLVLEIVTCSLSPPALRATRSVRIPSCRAVIHSEGQIDGAAVVAPTTAQESV